MTTVARLAERKYVSLTTYRRDGVPVATPLWVLPEPDALVVWTATDTWKVKRLRRNPAVTVAPCDARGRVSGEPVSGRGEIMPDEDAPHVRRMIMKKYGVLGRLVVWGSLLRRGSRGTIGIRIRLTEA